MTELARGSGWWRRTGYFWLLACTLLLALAPLPARSDDAPFVPPMPLDMDKVQMSLLTVGRGDAVYALYGHTILRVVDPEARLDLAFNWGIFDFQDPGFIAKFYIGDLRYQLAINETSALVREYEAYDKRAVVEDALVLTKAQKTALMRRLIENARPANIFYNYNQFYDNCATKPRDHLDQALGGRIKARYGKEPARETFRFWIRHGARAIWWVYLGLDQISNSLLDQPVSTWDQMFLPANLRASLLAMPAYDDQGGELPGRHLLEPKAQLLSFPEPKSDPDPYRMSGIVLFALLTPLALGAVTSRSAVRARRCFGAALLIFGLWSSVWGTVLALNWLVSRYAELQHNAILWLMWPLDWLFVALGARALAGGRWPQGTLWGQRLAACHLAALAVALGGWGAGLIAQNILGSLATSGAAGLLVYGSFLIAQRRQEAG